MHPRNVHDTMQGKHKLSTISEDYPSIQSGTNGHLPATILYTVPSADAHDPGMTCR